ARPWEVERPAEPEKTGERPARPQIARAGVEHRRVRVEQREPRVRDGSGTEPDDLGETRRDPGADPGRAQRALTLARADVGSDDGDERPTKPEYERNQKVLEARADPVAGDRRGSEAADVSGRDRDRQIRVNGDQGGDRAHS